MQQWSRAYRVEERQVPVVGQSLPRDWVCLTANSEDGLNGDVHDHKALATEAVRQDLEGVSDEQARPGETVEDAEHPDERDLSVTGACIALARVFVHRARDRPADEVDDHARGGDQEELAAPDFVDEGCGVEGDDEGEDAFTASELCMSARSR